MVEKAGEQAAESKQQHEKMWKNVEALLRK